MGRTGTLRVGAARGVPFPSLVGEERSRPIAKEASSPEGSDHRSHRLELRLTSEETTRPLAVPSPSWPDTRKTGSVHGQGLEEIRGDPAFSATRAIKDRDYIFTRYAPLI